MDPNLYDRSDVSRSISVPQQAIIPPAPIQESSSNQEQLAESSNDVPVSDSEGGDANELTPSQMVTVQEMYDSALVGLNTANM